MSNKKSTSMEEMGAMVMHSKEWFSAAFENMEGVPDFAKKASERICHAYGIRGQADPGYIANVINASYEQGQGLYTIDAYSDYVNKNQKNPPDVKKVIVTPGYVEVKERFKNCKLLRLIRPYTKLVQVGENLQLYWTDINDYPTDLSWFWLTEAPESGE